MESASTPFELSSTWDQVGEQLRSSVPDSTYRIWLEPLRAVALEGGTLYLKAPTGIRTWVERRYADLITEAAARVQAAVVAVSFEPPPGTDERDERLLNPTFSFERFVIGDQNRIAHGAALAVAEAPGEAYNPLFLHGPPGLGKTHLLVAIANYLRHSAPSLQVRYTTAEGFTNEFVTALHTQGTDAFKHCYRDLDVLLVDDVQFLQGKHHTEEEFFHTFNALHDAGSQLVLSADRIPSELSTLAARLRDRFEWGMTVALEPPNLATRLTVLRRLVKEAGMEMRDGDGLDLLARTIDANIRQLNGGLTRVIAHASMLARPLSPELVADVLPKRPQAPPEVSRIRTRVSDSLGVPESALTGPSRSTQHVRARQIAIYLTRELTDLSLADIGREFGGRDHSTVLSSIRKVAERTSTDPQARDAVEKLRVALGAPASPAP